jgi:hypothetical protein
METGIVGLPAPQLEHVRWIDENGAERSPLTLAELGRGFKILYFFQDWCAGCHCTWLSHIRDTCRGTS